MNTNKKTAINESKMKITGWTLMRMTGLAAIITGIIFVVVQMIHPPEVLSSVTTSSWAVVHYLSIAMCLFGLLGITGIYVRHVKEAGWFGLVGYLMFGLFLAFTMAFVFIEALVSPSLVIVSPKFVEGLLGMISSSPSEINLGALPTIYLLTGLLYMVGGVVFGASIFRASVLPRWAGAMLAIGTMLPVVLPHDIVRLAAVPVGLALIWMGYALFSERGEKVSQPLAHTESPQLSQVVVK